MADSPSDRTDGEYLTVSVYAMVFRLSYALAEVDIECLRLT